MEWKTKLGEQENQLVLPPYFLHDRQFEIVLDGKPYFVKYHEKLNTLFIRKPDEKVFRNIKLKRLKVSKSDDSSEFGVDFEFLSAGNQHSSALQTETWIYTPASEHRRKAQAAKGATLRSPMTGKVLKVNCKNGDRVKKGDTLLVIEAMKMENKIAAPTHGVIEGMKIEVGANVNANDLLAQIKPQADS